MAWPVLPWCDGRVATPSSRTDRPPSTRTAHRLRYTKSRKLQLQVTSTKVTGVGLKDLRHLDKLAYLDLAHSPITDAGLKEIAGLKGLRRLTLIGTRVTEAGLMELAKLKDLEDLTISKGVFTEKVMDDLRKALPKRKFTHFSRLATPRRCGGRA